MIEDWTKAIEISPRDAKAYYNHGIAREAPARKEPARARAHLEAAATDLQKALEVAPQN